MNIFVKLDDGSLITIPITDFHSGCRKNGKYRVILTDCREGVWITKAEALETDEYWKMTLGAENERWHRRSVPRAFVPAALFLSLFVGLACSPGTSIEKGDMSRKGGTATKHKPHEVIKDDLTTTNDESNDQPLGHYGTASIKIRNLKSFKTYTLDADFEEGDLQRIYFPKGGWLDFTECDYDLVCTDEKGSSWPLLEEVED